MNKKQILLIGTIIIVLIGGTTLFSLNEHRKERKAAELIEMETTTAKQIKNTFADVTEIKFAEEYGKNIMTGYTGTMVTITTSSGVIEEIGIYMYLGDESNKLESYGGPVKVEEGVTKNKVKVIFSTGKEVSL